MQESRVLPIHQRAALQETKLCSSLGNHGNIPRATPTHRSHREENRATHRSRSYLYQPQTETLRAMDSCLIERIQPKGRFTILRTSINRPIKNYMELGEPVENHLHTSPMRRRAEKEEGVVVVSRGQDLNLRPPGVCPPGRLSAAPLWAQATAGRCWPP